MDKTFDICVKIMEIYSDKLGITYKEFNVILFVIVQPLLSVLLFLLFLIFYMKYKKLKKK